MRIQACASLPSVRPSKTKEITFHRPHKQHVVLAPLLDTEHVRYDHLVILSQVMVELSIVYLQSAFNVLLTKLVKALQIGHLGEKGFHNSAVSRASYA